MCESSCCRSSVLTSSLQLFIDPVEPSDSSKRAVDWGFPFNVSIKLKQFSLGQKRHLSSCRRDFLAYNVLIRLEQFCFGATVPWEL